MERVAFDINRLKLDFLSSTSSITSSKKFILFESFESINRSSFVPI